MQSMTASLGASNHLRSKIYMWGVTKSASSFVLHLEFSRINYSKGSEVCQWIA